jgi:hypothetical protein
MVALSLAPAVATLFAAAAQQVTDGGSALSTRPRFDHSWDTLPVFWFSANESALEGPKGMALMARYPIAILAWQTDVKGDPAWRHSEDKMRTQAAELARSAPNTSVLAYIQGQLVEPWYDSQWKLMPPPCGNDTRGTFADYFLMDNHTGENRPAEWPGPNKAAGCEWMWNYERLLCQRSSDARCLY